MSQVETQVAQRRGVYVDGRVMAVGGCVALLGIVVLGFFLWMVPAAAARESKAACTGLGSQPPLNPALCAPGTTCKYPIAAPDFTAIDHNGKHVKLSDYRGKVVLLNFWASWCGVCKTEKPHLQEMAQDMAGQDFVVLALASDRNWTDVIVAIVAALAQDSGMTAARNITGEDDGAMQKLLAVLRVHPEERDQILNFEAAQHKRDFVEKLVAGIKADKPPTFAEALAAYQAALPKGVAFDVLLDPPAGEENIGAITASWGIKAVPESALIDRDGNIRHYFINKRDWQTPVAETCLRSVIDE